jgi:hypothetical protein
MTQLFLFKKNEISKSDMEDLLAIQADLARIVSLQSDPLLRIEDNLERAENAMIQAHNDLEKANKYYKDMKVIMIGTAVGSLAMTPLSVLLGVKIGLSTLVGGAILGGYGGYKAQQL